MADAEPTGSDTPEQTALDGEWDPAAVEAAARLLEVLTADPALSAAVPDDLRARLREACQRFLTPGRRAQRSYRKARKRKAKRDQRAKADALLDRTGIRRQQARLVYPTPPPDPADEAAGDTIGRLDDARTCYVCKAAYRDVHHFYDALCPACAACNWRKRRQTADCTGRVALLTGGRVKIGYQAGIKLLRAGASLIVTTRFPRDAAERYAREPDFGAWQDRLEIYGCDLRHTPSVETLAAHVVRTRNRLDFLLNNACQTVRRPPAFYAHLMEGESQPYDALPGPARRLLADYERLRESGALVRVGPGADATSSGLKFAAALSQVPLLTGDDNAPLELFPQGRLDADLQQVDLRDVNSWRLPLADVPTIELLEVHLVNAVAPFVLNARLKPLMLRTAERDKHIVNVSAMEGQFYRGTKTEKHPHTNMAKAALNMMTRTSAPDYVRDGIHMNSVDTGWITDEDPVHLTLMKREEHGFHPPLDHVDAAARICDPIFDGLNTGTHVWGQFLKDYRPAPW